MSCLFGLCLGEGRAPTTHPRARRSPGNFVLDSHANRGGGLVWRLRISGHGD